MNLAGVECDAVAFCDTDLAFTDNLSSFARCDAIVAKPVDFPNPPLEVLEAMRHAAGITDISPIAKTSCTPAETYASNCNGGVYVIPSSLLSVLHESWLFHAALCLNRSSILDKWAHHADQVGFALATLKLGLRVSLLPVEYNFPIHVPKSFDSMTFSRPRILHFHRCFDETGRLLSTGNQTVDEAIADANTRVRTFGARVNSAST